MTADGPAQVLDAPPQPKPGEPAPPLMELSGSRQVFDWLREQHVSIAFTTYQAGKVFFLGLQPEGRVSVFERTLNRCMGMCVAGNSLFISTLYQLWRFENALEPGQVHDGYDRLYAPKMGWVTGDLDIHDMGIDRQGRLVFINTLFGCIATTSDTHSFVPLWKPPFLSKLGAEDRAHVNGLALEDGVPRYVTAVSESDVADGWRDFRTGGGVIVDVPNNQVVVRGLSMPHSPRMYRGKLYLHNSGTGFFGSADATSGKFEPIAFCPGYLRGLDFIGDYAVMGISRPRHEKTFSGLPLDEALKTHTAEPRCGIQIVDLRTGDVVHWLRFEGVVQELYDVVVLPGVRRPMALGFVTDEIRRFISVGKLG